MSDEKTLATKPESDVKINLSTKDLPAEDRKMLKSMFLRTNCLYALWAGQAQAAAGGMLFTMEPALNRYYADQKKRAEAMSRYTSWYNITLNVHPVVSGICAAMERDAAEDENFDVSNIQAVKASLMGPLSGVGDAFFWGVLRIIAAGIGIGLAATGSPLGAIAFLLIYNIPSWIVRWGCQVLGFKLGTSFISKVSESGLMGVVTKAAGILGLLMIGAMTASNVAFNVALTIPVAGSDPIMVQTYLDAMFKGLIPMLITLGCFKLLKKNVNVLWFILGIMALGLVCGLLGIVA